MTSAGELDGSMAIIGMAGRFPGAPTIDALWRNLSSGTESITFFSPQELDEAGVPSAERDGPNYVPARAILDDIDSFDSGFFGYNARDAEIIDPQQRLFLECAWEAVEHAGYDTERYDGQIGVYGGSSMSVYLLNLLSDERIVRTVGPYRMLLANDKDHLTMRVAHKLDLRGPAVTVQTACSTSLVAVHMACQSVLARECDIALAGGVTISLPQISGYRYEQDGIMSPDGHCRAFDAQARGTVAGNGAGVVVLKRLADALADGDTVHAVIRGSAVNNDGSMKAGYTAPSSSGQAEVVAEALAVADVDPATVSYVEAHGTGTNLGDPIEISALARVFGGPAHDGPRALGSIKTNIGHLDAAAGVAGLIKTVLALRHRALPASLHFAEPNPKARLTESGFHVPTTLTPWPESGIPRRAGVSSFGMGGTNAHVVLEEAPPAPPAGPGRDRHLLTLSAATPTALDAMATELAGYLKERPSSRIDDVAYTLHVGRRTLRHRRVVPCRTRTEAIAALESAEANGFSGATDRPVAFLFPGQGAQRAGMAAELYQEEPLVRELVDECARLVSPELGFDLREALYPNAEPALDSPLHLRNTAVAQPALFTVEYALARLWMDWGVCPDAMIGHSVGEYVAACLAGVLSMEDALGLLVTRGRLVQSLPPGAMLSVPLPEDALLEMTGERVGLAAVNGPGLGVLAGAESAIAACEADLAAKGVTTKQLHTSHAFHSPLLDPVLADFRAAVAGVRLRPPEIPYLSNVTGTWITANESTSPDYWTAHLRQTVRFSDGVHTLLDRVLLEVGPGDTLTTLARQHGTSPKPDVVATLPFRPGDADVTSALGGLWRAGVRIDWHSYHRGEHRRRIPLPTYPFERERAWIGGGALPRSEPVAAPAQPRAETRTELEQIIGDLWQEMLGTDRIGMHDTFLELGGHSLLATQITARLREVFEVDLTLERFFELGTVSGLATEIEELLITELEKLTDDEVERLSGS